MVHAFPILGESYKLFGQWFTLLCHTIWLWAVWGSGYNHVCSGIGVGQMTPYKLTEGKSYAKRL